MTTSNLFTLPHAPGGWPGEAGEAPSARDYGLPDARDLQGLSGDSPARPRAGEAAYAPRVVPLARRAGRTSRLAGLPHCLLPVPNLRHRRGSGRSRLSGSAQTSRSLPSGWTVIRWSGWIMPRRPSARSRLSIASATTIYTRTRTFIGRRMRWPHVPPMRTKPRVRKCRALSVPAVRRISSSWRGTTERA
nr:cysteine desulfurase, SufS family [Raoultella sp. NCTC 9187]